MSAPRGTFVVRVFRMGWYGGVGAHLVTTTTAVRGHRQPAPVVQRPRRTVVTRWQPSLTLRTASWLPGHYLLRLDASTGAESFVPVTVRAPSARGAVVLVSPVTTWQAYNTWGGFNLYTGADGSFAARSRAVSFDRPYAAERGAGEFVERELPVVMRAERLGLRLDYVTDVDLQQRPGLLDGAAGVVSMGHDEYYSPAMRARLTAARDAGSNVAFLGANAVFRRIRFERSPLGPDRIEVNYKVASEDPMLGRHNRLVTSDWPAPPDPQPESTLTGAMYDCFHHGRQAGVVTDTHSFLFAGVQVHAEQRLRNLVGPEIDRLMPGRYPTPHPIQVLLHSPFACPGGDSYSDATYYAARSGAGVFDAGTQSWVCVLGGGCGTTRAAARVVGGVTDNLLRAFARPRAGATHPPSPSHP